jgi:superfamily II DNA or RNA helicase
MYLYCIITESWQCYQNLYPEILGRSVEKIGSTTCIEWRKFGDGQTFNLTPLKYKWYLQINHLGEFDSLTRLEKTVQAHPFFAKRHLIKGGGTEFFTFGEFESSLHKTCDILLDFGVRFKVFTQDIFLERPNNKNNTNNTGDSDNKEVMPLPMKMKVDPSINKIILRPYQERCLETMRSEKKGVLILPTGVGKTITFLFFLQETKGINVVLVPTKKLVEQTAVSARKMGFSVILCYSDNKLNKDDIKGNHLIISTYQSSKYLLEISFNTIIFDECHTTVLSSYLDRDSISSFQLMLTEGKAEKKFFFTATEKTVSLDEKSEDSNDEIFSMDNPDQYGKVLFRYRLDEAIMDGYLCDYNICMVVTTDKVSSLITELKRKKGKKVFIYCSSVERATNLSLHLRNAFSSAYIDALSSKTPRVNQNTSVQKFREHDGLSILCLCKLFIVGFNEPSIDIVVHFDKCHSVIELAQKNGRATRLYPQGKIRSTFVFMIEEGKPADMRYYKKVMKKLIFEDSRLEVKLKQLTENKCNDNQEHSSINLIVDIPKISEERTVYDRYVRNLCPSFDIKDEFDNLRRYVRRLQLKSKIDYRIRVSQDPVLVYEPDDYFGKNWTNWCDFLGIDESQYPKTKDEWKKLCQSLGVSSWSHYLDLQRNNPRLPEMPQDIYDEFTNFDDELGIN